MSTRGSAASEEVRDDEWTPEMGEPRGKNARGEPIGKPGRPRATETTITRRVLDDEPEVPQTFTALFGQGNVADEKRITRVRITRVDPNEGQLGYIDDMEATDAEIFERWGGSLYRLDGLNQKGQIMKSQQLRLSGDPKFVGEIFEQQWRKFKGLPPRGVAAGGQAGMSPQQVFEMMDAREQRQRDQQREWEDERRRRDEEAEERRRERERDWQRQRDAELREHELRLKREEEERDRRRRTEVEERDAQRRADLERQQQQSQQFMTNMLQIITASNQQSMTLLTSVQKGEGGGSNKLIEAVQVIASIKEAFGGGAEAAADAELDPVQLLVKNLPGILQGIGAAGSAIINEVRANRPQVAGQPVQQRLAPAQPGQPAPATPAAAPAVPVPPGGLNLPASSPLTPKLIELTQELAARGQNPEEALTQIADGVLTTLRTGKLPDGSAPVAAAPAAAAAPSLKDKPPVKLRFRKPR